MAEVVCAVTICPVATEAVVGRDAELARVQALLDRNGPEQLSALLLEGEPGIGKSTVWASGVAAARDAGFRVVMSRLQRRRPISPMS